MVWTVNPSSRPELLERPPFPDWPCGYLKSTTSTRLVFCKKGVFIPFSVYPVHCLLFPVHSIHCDPSPMFMHTDMYV